MLGAEPQSQCLSDTHSDTSSFYSTRTWSIHNDNTSCDRNTRPDVSEDVAGEVSVDTAQHESFIDAIPLVTGNFVNNLDSLSPIGIPGRGGTPVRSIETPHGDMKAISLPSSVLSDESNSNTDLGLDHLISNVNCSTICKGVPSEQLHNRVKSEKLYSTPTNKMANVPENYNLVSLENVSLPPPSLPPPCIPPPNITKLRLTTDGVMLSPHSVSWEPSSVAAPVTSSVVEVNCSSTPKITKEITFPDVSSIWGNSAVWNSSTDDGR